MRLILAISQNVFRKALRSKIFTVFLLLTLGFILLSKVFEFLTIASEAKLIKDVGLVAIAFFTALIAIFLSGEAITSEVEEKTIYTILSKPLTRWEFILGKFLGVIWAVLLALAVSGLAFFILLYLKGCLVVGVMFEAILFVFFETVVIASIGIMFSSLSSSTSTSTIFTFFVYLMGHFNPQLKFLGERAGERLVKWTIKIVGWILPNLEYFNVRERVVQDIFINPIYVGKAFLYATVYACAMLILAYLFLRQREF